MQNEVNKDQRKSLHILRYIAKGYESGLAAMLALMSALSIVPLIDSLMLKALVDRFSNPDNSSMIFWVWAYGLWWEVINILARGYDYFYLKTLPPVKQKAIDYFFNHLQYHDTLFFRDKLIGHLSSRITDAARSAEQLFAMVIERISRRAVLLVATVFILYEVHPVFAIILSVWLVLFVTINSLCASRIRAFSSEYADNKNHVSGRIVDALSNINVIRSFARQKYERAYLDTFNRQMMISDQGMQRFMLKLRYILGLSCNVMIAVVVYYLAELHAQQQVTVGDFALILGIFSTLADDIWGLMQDIGDVFEELGVFSQATCLLEPHYIQDVAGALPLNVKEGTIEVQHINFRYKYCDRLFNNLSVTIPSKQKVALVGFSGSGKTTFVSLINRTYEVEDGRILIDGQNISEISQRSLHDSISFIPQEAILFNRSIRDNIKYGNPTADDDEVVQAAKAAHIHDVITNLPKGYDYICGERGTALSGGQRQRIVIARAILKNAPIQVLDEATSALDSVTEQLIQQSLDYLMQNKTVLVIAHRLSTLPNMDRILVFEQGRIVEDGVHEELLKQQGAYFKLWNSQVNGLIA